MNKSFIVVLLLIGCSGQNNEPVLSIKPLTTYVPIKGAANLSYLSPAPNDNAYLDNTNVIQVDGLIGNYKLIIANDSNTDLTNVNLFVSANDPDKINQDLIFARIYREIFSGGDIFTNDGPPILPDGSFVYPNQKYDGRYTIIPSYDLPARSWIIFDAQVLGDPGLALHFSAYATKDDHYALSYGNEETSVIYMAE